MLTRMTEEDWTLALEVFDAAQSSRGEPGHDDRKFLEAILYFTVHNISWRALPAEFGNSHHGLGTRRSPAGGQRDATGGWSDWGSQPRSVARAAYREGS